MFHSASALSRVYPRVCGEAASPGLSPRVRGSRSAPEAPWPSRGSIPACAGKPADALRRDDPAGVYPRVCGEAVTGRAWVDFMSGLSPRVRGSQHEVYERARSSGSIPACAGKPAVGFRPGRRHGVYPRVCGEATPGRGVAKGAHGLSPRVRGSPGRDGRGRERRGSIPACAGKPCPRVRARDRCGVYPRVCGEASVTIPPAGKASGLSPRVRGSPAYRRRARTLPGSIPACAGKPRCGQPWSPACWVYPRVCGEAAGRPSCATGLRGLSPRVRGSPQEEGVEVASQGSIPACAGKPRW